MHDGLSGDLMDRYDGFILDQFGVLHNGSTALPGAVEAVTELHKNGKKLVILSNSSSLEANTISKLPKLGFDPEMFVGAVTSGQEAAKFLKANYQGKKALFLTWKTPKTPSPAVFIEACGDITVTNNPEEADFVLLHGCEVLRGPGIDGEASEQSLGGFHQTGDMSTVIDPLLQQCIQRQLPLVCANPDYIMVRPDHTQAHMPGKIADFYETMGGNVTSFGKPHRKHFEACVEQLQLPKNKIVHVGDSLHHDVAGANETEIASIFVTGGVHRDELGSSSKLGELPPKPAVETLFAEHKQTPTHVVPLLRL